MKYLGKVAGYNMLAILVYSILIRTGSASQDEQGLGLIFVSAIVVGIHVLLCLIISVSIFSDGDKALGKAWLLSAGIVLVVGFSACLGNAALQV